MSDVEWIYQIVDAFYEKARIDILIGYHFRNIKDFDEHIPRISSFWELQLLGVTDKILTVPFDVMRVHVPLGIKRGELGRWLVLFRQTIKDHEQERPELAQKWLEKLSFFEGVFLRFLGI